MTNDPIGPVGSNATPASGVIHSKSRRGSAWRVIVPWGLITFAFALLIWQVVAGRQVEQGLTSLENNFKLQFNKTPLPLTKAELAETRDELLRAIKSPADPPAQPDFETLADAIAKHLNSKIAKPQPATVPSAPQAPLKTELSESAESKIQEAVKKSVGELADKIGKAIGDRLDANHQETKQSINATTSLVERLKTDLSPKSAAIESNGRAGYIVLCDAGTNSPIILGDLLKSTVEELGNSTAGLQYCRIGVGMIRGNQEKLTEMLRPEDFRNRKFDGLKGLTQGQGAANIADNFAAVIKDLPTRIPTSAGGSPIVLLMVNQTSKPPKLTEAWKAFNVHTLIVAAQGPLAEKLREQPEVFEWIDFCRELKGSVSFVSLQNANEDAQQQLLTRTIRSVFSELLITR